MKKKIKRTDSIKTQHSHQSHQTFGFECPTLELACMMQTVF